MHRGAAPRAVSRGAHRTGNAPDLWRVIGKGPGEFLRAPGAVGAGSGLRILKPVHPGTPRLPAAAKIKPGEWILIGPQQRSPNVVIRPVAERVTLPRIPRICRQCMSRRTDAQQNHRRKLAIFVVAEPDKSLGTPAMREQFAIAIGHPDKVVAVVKLGCQITNFGILMKILAAGEGAGEQPDRVAG